MELGPQNHTGDGLLGANSIMAVYMDPLGLGSFSELKTRRHPSTNEPDRDPD